MPGQTGDSYGVRLVVVALRATDRRLLRSPARRCWSRFYRQETPTESGSSLLRCALQTGDSYGVRLVVVALRATDRTPTESSSSLLVAVLQTGDSYGVRSAVVGSVSTDRRLLRSRLYAVCEIACSLPNAA